MGDGCNCLCSIVHPAKAGVCTGEAIYDVPFKDRTTGTITRVAMCGPCKEAALDTSSFESVAGQTVTVQRPPDDYVVIADTNANSFVVAKSALRDFQSAGEIIAQRIDEFKRRNDGS